MKTPILALAAAATLAFPAAMAQQSTGGGSLEAGMLTCNLTSSTNLVVISDANYECVFDTSDDSKPDEIYTMNIAKLGVDLSIEKAETLKWAVLSATGRFDQGLITGEYVGASADAAFGLGAGARVQIGGLDDSITLQPVSVSGREGLGIAAGVEQMSLEFKGTVS
ncbi:DUF992 domain-containing protein [Halovulum marinum]|nr:DUF992 domain-containing protein [Halovulum marinum]